MTAAALSTADVDYVRQLVHQQAAIVLDASKAYLVESRLLPVARRHGAASVGDLIGQLRSSPANGLHTQVVEALTTNETSWFRDLHPFTALEKAVIPALLQARATTRSLNIWSAACSSGQEPYSLAMMLRDRFPQLRDWNVRIIATDISSEMLGRAAAGRFSQMEVNRGLPAPMLVRWFQRDGLDWCVKDELRQMVEFRALNLATDWGFLPPLDIVMLRNVLIYFSVDTKREILAKVVRQLRPDGALFLGAAETTLGICDDFERDSVEKASFYRPRKGGKS